MLMCFAALPARLRPDFVDVGGGGRVLNISQSRGTQKAEFILYSISISLISVMLWTASARYNLSFYFSAIYKSVKTWNGCFVYSSFFFSKEGVANFIHEEMKVRIVMKRKYF